MAAPSVLTEALGKCYWFAVNRARYLQILFAAALVFVSGCSRSPVGTHVTTMGQNKATIDLRSDGTATITLGGPGMEKLRGGRPFSIRGKWRMEDGHTVLMDNMSSGGEFMVAKWTWEGGELKPYQQRYQRQ